MASYPPETSARIQVWRAKAKAGTLTIEDMTQAIKDLRSHRQQVEVEESQPKAEKVPKIPKKPAAKRIAAPAKSGDDLLSELEGL